VRQLLDGIYSDACISSQLLLPADGFYLVPTKKRNCGTSPVRQLLDGIYSDACISSQLLLPADGFYLVPTKHNNCGTSPETGVAFTDIVDSQ
jgi:hypothetical protein